MGELFNTNNTFWTFVSKLVDAMVLGLIWIACCVPIITIGPATTAVYYITLKMVRDEEGYMFASFWKSFRQNFKQGVILWLIYLVVGGFFAFDIYYYYQQPSQVGGILLMAFIILSVIYLLSLLYIFPILSKFSNTTKNLFRSSTILPLRHFFSTVLILVELILSILIVGMLPPMIIFMPGIFMFVSSYHFRNIFDIYCEKITAREEAEKAPEEDETEETEDAAEASEEEASDAEESEPEEAPKKKYDNYVFGDGGYDEEEESETEEK